MITHILAPDATFSTKADLEEFADEAIATERVIAEFRRDGCEAALWEEMLSLGHSREDVETVVANPAAAFGQHFGWPVD
jgi:hypothetical protein